MRIIGTGSARPQQTITNEQLTTILNTSDEWIKTRTGIQSRRVLGDESLVALAAKAAKDALDMAGLSASDIDFVLCSNVFNSYMTPGLGYLVQLELGMAVPSMDINAACAGFVYALETAQSHIKAKRYQTILVLAAEAISRMADWTDRATCVLFGDGAGAAICTAGGQDMAFSITSQPSTDFLYAINPPGNCPFNDNTKEARLIQMNGQEVYKYAVAAVSQNIQSILNGCGLSFSDIDYYLLHQANIRILDTIRMKLKQPNEKFPSHIATHGNTSSASVALLLDELNRAGQLKEDMRLLLCAFGAGLTTATGVLHWALSQ